MEGQISLAKLREKGYLTIMEIADRLVRSGKSKDIFIIRDRLALIRERLKPDSNYYHIIGENIYYSPAFRDELIKNYFSFFKSIIRREKKRNGNT